jgi:hypothetical protein
VGVRGIDAPFLTVWRYGIRGTLPSDLGYRPTLDISIPGLKVQIWGAQSALAEPDLD